MAKRLPATRGLPTAKRISRLAGMLARKGYPSGLTLQVVRAGLAAEGDARRRAGRRRASDAGRVRPLDRSPGDWSGPDIRLVR